MSPELSPELSGEPTSWFNGYKEKRKYSSLDKQTPKEAYSKGLELLSKAVWSP
jgi:hypothetical protein